MCLLSRPLVRQPSQDSPVDAGFLYDTAAWLRDRLIGSPCICSAASAHTSFSGVFCITLDIYHANQFLCNTGNITFHIMSVDLSLGLLMFFVV